MSDMSTDEQQPGERQHMVASVLSLVVQHCPSASHDPRDLCSLLQVSTACRTALQATKGHCCPTIKGPPSKLASYAAWLPQHTGLIRGLTVDVTASATSCSDQQLAAVIAAHSGLKCFSITGRRVFDSSLLGSLSSHTQLTYLCIGRAAVDAISCIPASVKEANLVVDVSTVVGATADPLAPPTGSLDLQHLVGLRSLDLTLWFVAESVEQGGGVCLIVPSGLTQLRLHGPVAGIQTGQQQQQGLDLSALKVFAIAGDELHIGQLAQLISSLPRLQDLSLSGKSCLGGDDADDDGFLSLRSLDVPTAHVLADAMGSATQLTALRVDSFSMVFDFGDFVPDAWALGERLTRLSGLKRLELGVQLLTGDVFALAALTSLTSLRLTKPGHDFGSSSIERICRGLSGLQELAINDSSAQDCDQLLKTVAQLTKLSVLCLDGNYFGSIVGMHHVDVELLLPLVHLTSLTLPPGAAAGLHELELDVRLLFDRLPRLEIVRADEEMYTRAGGHALYGWLADPPAPENLALLRSFVRGQRRRWRTDP